MNRKQLEAIVHEEVQSFTESMLNENPAVIATAARMAIQNKQGKKVSVNTARQSGYAKKDPGAHKKAKGIFQRIKDKFKKKESVDEGRPKYGKLKLTKEKPKKITQWIWSAPKRIMSKRTAGSCWNNFCRGV